MEVKPRNAATAALVEYFYRLVPIKSNPEITLAAYLTILQATCTCCAAWEGSTQRWQSRSYFCFLTEFNTGWYVQANGASVRSFGTTSLSGTVVQTSQGSSDSHHPSLPTKEKSRQRRALKWRADLGAKEQWWQASRQWRHRI